MSARKFKTPETLVEAHDVLARQRPRLDEDAPVTVWETWHERMMLAARDARLIEAVVYLTEQHRVKLKELREDTKGASRQGYWTR